MSVTRSRRKPRIARVTCVVRAAPNEIASPRPIVTVRSGGGVCRTPSIPRRSPARSPSTSSSTTIRVRFTSPRNSPISTRSPAARRVPWSWPPNCRPARRHMGDPVALFDRGARRGRPACTFPTTGSLQYCSDPASARRSSAFAGTTMSKVPLGDSVTTVSGPGALSVNARWISFHESGRDGPMPTISAPGRSRPAPRSRPAGCFHSQP